MSPQDRAYFFMSFCRMISGVFVGSQNLLLCVTAVLITKRMVGRLKDVQVFRGVAAGMSDHFSVEAKVVVAKSGEIEW